MAELAGLPIPTMDWHSPDAPQAFKKFQSSMRSLLLWPAKSKVGGRTDKLSRYKLRTLKQEPGESVDSFVKKIRILVEECRFTSPFCSLDL